MEVATHGGRTVGAASNPRQASKPEAARPPRTLTLREVFCMVAVVVLADLTVYRGAGFAGIAAMVVGAMALLWIGKRGASQQQVYRWVVAALLIASALKLLWEGSLLLSLFAGFLLTAFVVALEGRAPYILNMPVRSAKTPSRD